MCIRDRAYKENNLWQDFKAVTVIIDPSTGKLIDIESFNYYYDYAVGSNSLTFTRRYPSCLLYTSYDWADQTGNAAHKGQRYGGAWRAGVR